VVVRLNFAQPRDSELLERQVRRSLSMRAKGARVGRIDPAGHPQFCYLRVDGRTSTMAGAGVELAALVRGLGRDVGAAKADLVMWNARRRGLRHLRHSVSAGSGGGGGNPGNGGSGTAGVREPRRPRPPGFPPMQAALDPVTD
jgi:hypothetical protein